MIKFSQKTKQAIMLVIVILTLLAMVAPLLLGMRSY